MNIFDTPEKLLRSIPTDVKKNIRWQMEKHTILEKDSKLQDIFLEMCFADPRIFFNAVVWTKDPRKPPGTDKVPFILRPRQEEVVWTIKDSIENQKNMAINKSRDEGATELVTKMYAMYCLLPERYFIVGSRNEDLVDCSGDPFTLFAKIDFAFDSMPAWLKVRLGPWKDVRKHMTLVIPSTGSVIKGETTNESFSAGRRATSMFLDEFGRVEMRVAKSIEGSVHDVSGSIIYGSTHWFGEKHPFNLALKKKTTMVVSLPWWVNPVKNEGLYKSPEYNIIKLVDRDYYVKKYPNIVWPEEEFNLSKFEQEHEDIPRFIADGGDNIQQSDLRSPWHDEQEETRAGDTRDFICNVWMSPLGSQDSVFNQTVLNRIETQYIKKPSMVGDIIFGTDVNGRVKNPKYAPIRKKLTWWGPKPSKKHNYVIGCDISAGTGNSNSVAAILDVNTGEIVGTWVCPKTAPQDFAAVVRALALWCQGNSGEAYVIFENNFEGQNFVKRLRKHGQKRIYQQRTELTRTKKTQNKWGWHSSPNDKSNLLGNLGISLTEGLKDNPKFHFIRIFDKEILSELRSYVYYDNGDIGASEEQDLASGARKRHGDRVIAVGLCCLGKSYQAKVKITKVRKPKFGSLKQRMEAMEEERDKQRKTERRFWF